MMTECSSVTSCLQKASINKRLLPMKLHYFLLYGAIGAVLPYMPVVGKDLGINATAVGLVYTIVPFVVLFSKPGFGVLTDHFQNLRLIMYVLVIVTTVSFFLVTLIPPINSGARVKADVTLLCRNESILFHVPTEYNTTCVKMKIGNGTQCDLKIIDDLENHPNVQIHLSGNTSQGNSELSFHRSDDELVMFRTLNDSLGDKINVGPIIETLSVADIATSSNLTFTRICNGTGEVYGVNCKSNLGSCFTEKETDEHWETLYNSYQFWLYAFLSVLCGTGSATLFCLSDAACMEILDDQTELYGKQRLWATISWGMSTLLAGYLNDLASSVYSYTTYAPGFYLMIGLVVLDLFALHRVAPVKSRISTSICKDVGRIFASWEIVSFAVAVTVIGAMSGLLWNYQFWFLQDLGANQLLLGLTVAVQCLLAEVPLFFLSGYIIRTLGHFYCLVGSFGAFCLRYCLYFFLKDPWLTLPIEILHGQTFGVFYATMTSYAKTRAPAGTEATMIGVMGGLFEGLGIAIGSILSGIGFDHLTGRYTFLTAGVISGVFSVVFIIIRLKLGRPK